jgi:hypothetical protein
VSVPLVPEEGPGLKTEISCCIQNLPEMLRYDHKYQNP